MKAFINMNFFTRLLTHCASCASLPVLFILLTANPQEVRAQEAFVGKWKGVITQNDGGYRSLYDFEMYFRQVGRNLEGRSYVKVDEIYAEMELTAFVMDDKTIQFTEVKIVDSKKVDNLEWCFKSGKLTLVKELGQLKLVDPWEGFSAYGPCIPGRIILVKEIPRA